jgi:DNA-binding NarL/FixJ family response regulator
LTGAFRNYSASNGSHREPEWGVGLKARMASLSTLVVEDVEDFRRFLCTTLEQKTPCVVIGEASDGLEAVKKAEELQPDLILLDLGLPKLNGMEAARRIRLVAPNSKILIVSQEASVEVVVGAIRLGARGYLCKTDADELPVGVEALANGAQFVSSRLRHILPTERSPASNPGSS